MRFAGHGGYRWIDYNQVDKLTEQTHIHNTIQIIENLTGQRK
ncbi:hypothetical protein [Coxiella-like endosymbiont]|nr:hypothetical protein [Coxiella-like endosymbiont]